MAQLFPTGTVLLGTRLAVEMQNGNVTNGIFDIDEQKKDIAELFAFKDRHAQGDWGEVTEHVKQQNEQAIKSGGWIVSCYTTREEAVVVIATHPDRRVTSIVLLEEDPEIRNLLR